MAQVEKFGSFVVDEMLRCSISQLLPLKSVKVESLYCVQSSR